MELKNLIELIQQEPNCIVKPVNKKFGREDSSLIPNDLLEFYNLSNGLVLFKNETYEFEIVGKDELERANPIIVGEPCEYDISHNWYIIAKGHNEQFISIDLHKDRLGKCYDSFWETHGLRGETPVIANSFLDLLNNLYLSKGQSLYWLDDSFKALGDAYDDIPED